MNSLMLLSLSESPVNTTSHLEKGSLDLFWLEIVAAKEVQKLIDLGSNYFKL